jgi:alkanesulfonate monooxygenase SsuD/methylene tetrahydromethanopterin reductase-like flavin-dependent oxidoreductase (luciferase family)
MVAISITVEGTAGGLNWPRWKRLVTAVEELGFAGLFCSDHFGAGTGRDSLEAIVVLTYLADHSKRVHFGPMVSPVSFRDPVMLARQAIALDLLSEGRLILGVGSGYDKSEHEMFGYELGDVPTWMNRFEEGLEVITQLLRSDEPVTFEGRFFRLRKAMLHPRPTRAGRPQILVGAKGPKRALPIVARYADIWNATQLSPDAYRERSVLLDDLLQQLGRQPNEVKRTMTLPVLCGRDESELRRRIYHLRHLFPDLADQPWDVVRATIHRVSSAAILGTPQGVIDGLSAYIEAGVEEIMIQWASLDDIEGLEILAESVLPRLARAEVETPVH